ncbi:FkbM family methyltransferase [Flavobacterium sp. P4023]|uniref:FkbM family methyltransferase n=1 Tax=Flavobacterium flabelliforme TaxID=2816119 RepID=A0ABS5CPG7_9FLAO|nr:FkbM family methyltransferase [Flavobacterium flabelliforme]MBP4140514.1 FkbM family methyltransferase [Flavobacterium flabelliforme]
MNKSLKKYLKELLFSMGYKISKINNIQLQNSNPFLACKAKIKTNKPVVFDIGMNHGQTLNKILEIFPESFVYGFEASKYCFKDLILSYSDKKNVVMNNTAMGDIEGILKFNEYSWDAMNSFLERSYGKAHIIETYDVNVTTVDDYCFKNQIAKINLLKSDTEGFELKVLKGAKKMMIENKIQFVLIELFFDLNFFEQSSVGEIFSYLENNDFSLVKFYDFSLTGDGLASKSDALFINNKF